MGLSTSIVSFTSLPPSSTKLIAPLVDTSARPFALSAAIRRSQLCRVGRSRHTSTSCCASGSIRRKSATPSPMRWPLKSTEVGAASWAHMPAGRPVNKTSMKTKGFIESILHVR